MMAMAVIGFVLLGGLGLYFMVSGIFLFFGAAALGVRREGLIGIAIALIGVAIIWLCFANAPFTISFGAS